MIVIDTLYRWYGKRTVWAVGLLIVGLAGAGLYSAMGASEEGEAAATLPTVAVGQAGTQNGAATITLIGTVKALEQAEIETEVPGRITSVRVGLGDRVSAGAVIATQENASERAAVLQAEGAYEAALAGAAQSTVSVDEAQNSLTAARNSAVTTIRSTYTTVSGVVYDNIDDLFSQPRTPLPGLLINGRGQTSYLNSERVALQALLPSWQQDVNELTAEGNLSVALTQAEEHTRRVLTMVDTFIALFNDQDANARFSETDYRNLSVTFNNLRSALLSSLSAIDQARTGLESAERALERARIGGSGPAVSAADAQVKQALGALRAAQANLEKTILRTPISGTVNSVAVDAGDFVGSFTPVAVVANNDALEITTYVGASDRDEISVGDEVTIEADIVGTITRIAEAVDPTTRKIEVKIATESGALAAGDTVTISLTDNGTTESPDRLFIPITAVKFTQSDGVVFTVEENTLVANPVSIGEIRGSFVEITEGISPQTDIVLDARGRAAGQSVEPVSN